MWNGGSIVVCQWVLVCAMLMLNVTSPASLEAQGLLENPPAGLTLPQSGAGLVSGWHCNAEQIDIEIDGSAIFQAAYGTSREDTLTECGDADNGFGLLVNWNLIELENPGITHTVRALADSVEFGRAEVTIVTFGEELLTGAAGTFNLDADFLGRTVTVQWREALQNFVIIGATVEARLENPETVFRIL